MATLEQDSLSSADVARAAAAAAVAARRRTLAAAAARRRARLVALRRVRALATRRAADVARAAAARRVGAGQLAADDRLSAVSPVARQVAAAGAREGASALRQLEQRRVEARRQSYDVLRSAAAVARARVASRISAGGARPAVRSGGDTRVELLREQRVGRVVRASEAEARRARRERAAAGGDVRGMERAMREEAQLGLRADTKAVGLLAHQYVAQAEKAAARYKTVVGAITRALDAGKVGRARRLYGGVEFREAGREYERLFGKAGAFNAFWADYRVLERAQADFWRRQMGAQLGADRRAVERRYQDALRGSVLGGDRAELQRLARLRAALAGKTGVTVDHYERGGAAEGDMGPLRPVYRRRTIEEELEFLEARRRTEMEGLRARYEAERVRLAHYDREERVARPLDRAVQERLRKLYGVEPPRVRRPEDVMGVADRLMADWEADHLYPRLAGQTRAAAMSEAQRRWHASRGAFERAVYALYGAQVPGPLERVFALPGVSHVLAGLQLSVAATGALARMVNQGLFGESKVGGYHPDLDALPAAVKARLAAVEGVAEEIRTGRARIMTEFLAAPAGQRWAERGEVEARERGEAEYGEFARVIGGGLLGGGLRGDAGEVVEAINRFGSVPFQDAVPNLMFQLLADPLIGVPLKFTKYFARAGYAAERAGKTKFLGSTKFGRVRDFLAVDEGTLRLRKELGKFLAANDVRVGNVGRLTDELLADLAGIGGRAERYKVWRRRLAALGLSRRAVNDAQLFSLVEAASVRRVKEAGVAVLSQADVEKRLVADEAAAGAAKATARRESQAAAALRAAGAQRRQAAEGATARRRLLESKRATEARLGAKVKAGAEAPAVARAGVKPAVRVVRPLSRVSPVEAGVGRVVVKRASRRASVELRRARHAGEYYKPDVMGNWVPKESNLAESPAYRAVAEAARGGDAEAAGRLARLAREKRNVARMLAEDRPTRSPFTPTDFDLLERAGVAHDEAAAARLLADRETVRHIKRMASRSAKTDDQVREFALVRGRRIEREFDIDALPSADRLDIGDDILAARASPRGLNDAYEVFSGLPNRTRYYDGGVFAKVRSASWRRALGEKRFGELLRSLDDEAMGGGVAGFRDGGQALFELFHRLRLSDLKKLQRLSGFVDAHLAELVDPGDSLFGWLWKAMEERSGLAWAWDWQVVEAGFLGAAERWSMHPNLALAMVPNGFFAHRAPNRFRLSSALLGLGDSAVFRAAPAGWVEADALKAVSALFVRGTPGGATRVVQYTAERFGSFAKAFKIRNRVSDELTAAVSREMGAPELAKALADSPYVGEEVRAFAERQGRSVEDVLGVELARKPGRFPDGSLKRPEFGPAREAVLDAYWGGRVTVRNAEAHKLLLLASLQDNPAAWVEVTRRFVSHMSAAGELDGAKVFLRELFGDRIDNLAVRYASERLGQAERQVDMLTGEVREVGLRKEWALWDELGFTPDVDRVRAWVEGRGERFAGDAAEASKLRRLGQYDSEEDLVRDLWRRGDVGDSPLAYAGNVDADALGEAVEGAIEAFRAGDRRAIAGLGRDLERAARRILFEGATGVEFEAIRDAVAPLRGLPEANVLVERLRDAIGDEALGRWLNMVGSFPAYRLAAKAGVKLAPARVVKPVVESAAEAVELVPTQTVGLSRAGALLQAIGGMDELAWWDYVVERAKAVLASRTASAGVKRRARQALADVERARYARRLAESNGAYVSPSERGRYARRVVAEHGKEAEGMIAPKQVAPYVEDAQALAVEQSRTYWRSLRSASEAAGEGGVRRLGPGHEALDHFPKELWDPVEQEVADAIARARGFRADTRVRRRGRPVATGEEGARSLGRLSDTDPIVVAAKQAVLDRHGIAVAAYDEARKALWRGYVQNKSATWLMTRAREVVARFGGEYRDVYLRLRLKAAREEARRQLRWLAWGELYGQTPAEVLAEFVARWGDDGQLRAFTVELSAFQRRTLEAHVRAIAGIDNLDDAPRMAAWLRSRNAPPLHSREAARDYLTEIGAWSPRRAEQIAAGAESWSVADEATYWRAAYGEVPEWADRGLLGGSLSGIFHDQELYYAQMRAWGIFNRSAEVRLRLSGATAKEIEEKVLAGDPVLGLRGKRELDLQRRYVIERYGDLVADGDRLIAMPWLMYPDELRAYFGRRVAGEIADDLIQNADELATVERLIDEGISDFWEKYIGPKALDGPVMYEDIFRMASEIQARLLADPVWAGRLRDRFGHLLNAWASVNRAIIFTNPSFALMNIVDAPLKGMWYRFTRRGLFNPGLHGQPASVVRRAMSLTPADLGLDVETTLYRLRQRPALDYLVRPMSKGLRGALERVTALPRAAYRASPALAGKAELAVKMQLARGMFPEVFGEALAKLGDRDLADAFARKFIREEIGRMWPTVGDHPLEKLWNQLVPFGSYSVKNKLLFLSEAVAHPSVLNQIEFVGRFVEAENRRRWAREHPDEPFPDWKARQIELPWAPGYFLDLSQFSDATRGLRPLYNAERPRRLLDIASEWVRLVNPGSEAGIYALLNAFGLAQQVRWQAVYNEDGFVMDYERILTGQTEPWSKDEATLGSAIWLLEAMEDAERFGAGGWTNGELSVLVGKVLFFGAITGYDRGAALNDYYFALREKDEAMARRWLEEGSSGAYLQDWWRARGPYELADFWTLAVRREQDPKRWFHSESAAFQKAVRGGYESLSGVRRDFEARLLGMTPGTEEYRLLKAEMLLAIANVYAVTPELMRYEVYSKSAAEWSKQLVEWEVRRLTDAFFALDGARPQRKAFASKVAYERALEAWRHQKEVFLATYPQVREAIGASRTEYQRVRLAVEAEWDAVLMRIAKRGKAIVAAREVDDRDKLDLLYLAQELDYSLLEQDHVALFFDAGDFESVAGVGGGVAERLRAGALRAAQLVLDFDARRREKAKREGRLTEFEDDQFYFGGLRAVVLKAKGGDPLGKFDPAVFVAELRRRPRLLRLYFARNPGKEAKWRRAAEYIRLIGPWGRAARRGDWDTAERLWSRLPTWVKDQYYAKHPERRRTAVATAAFVGWMGRWVAHFERNDVKGGMEFFWGMPEWVRERYFGNHPEKRAKYEAQLRFGRELSDYFAADPADRPAHLERHPELVRFLARNVSDKERVRQVVLAEYRAIPMTEQWLRRVFREAHPEIFSQEVAGRRRLRAVYEKLARHPDLLPEFERWVAAIMASYNEMVRRSAPRPKAFTLDRSESRRKRSLSSWEVARTR